MKQEIDEPTRRARWRLQKAIYFNTLRLGYEGWRVVAPCTAEIVGHYGLAGEIVSYKRERDGLTEEEVHRFRINRNGSIDHVLVKGDDLCPMETTDSAFLRTLNLQSAEDAEQSFTGGKQSQGSPTPATGTGAPISLPARRLINSVAGKMGTPQSEWIVSKDLR